MSEHEDQVAIFEALAWAANRHEELNLVFAVPNAGKRSWVVGKMMKQEGLKKGVPDIWFPVPKNNWSGLVIEQKFDKNKTTKEQAWWLNQLALVGWYCKVSWSVGETLETFETYLGKKLFL